jgi:hypothetical protein
VSSIEKIFSSAKESKDSNVTYSLLAFLVTVTISHGNPCHRRVLLDDAGHFQIAKRSRQYWNHADDMEVCRASDARDEQ